MTWQSLQLLPLFLGSVSQFKSYSRFILQPIVLTPSIKGTYFATFAWLYSWHAGMEMDINMWYLCRDQSAPRKRKTNESHLSIKVSLRMTQNKVIISWNSSTPCHKKISVLFNGQRLSVNHHVHHLLQNLKEPTKLIQGHKIEDWSGQKMKKLQNNSNVMAKENLQLKIMIKHLSYNSEDKKNLLKDTTWLAPHLAAWSTTSKVTTASFTQPA